MRKLILGFLTLFLLGGVGTVGLKALNAPAYAGGGGAVEGAGWEYVELSPLMLPIIDDSGVSQVVNLVVSIEVNSGNAGKVEQMKPRLTDAFLQDMYGVLNRHAAMEGGILQIGLIKERLNALSDKMMGDDDVVHDVLLQVVEQRPI